MGLRVDQPLAPVPHHGHEVLRGAAGEPPQALDLPAPARGLLHPEVVAPGLEQVVHLLVVDLEHAHLDRVDGAPVRLEPHEEVRDDPREETRVVGRLLPHAQEGVRLPRARLPVGQDAPVVPPDDVLQHRPPHRVVHLQLRGLGPEHRVEGELLAHLPARLVLPRVLHEPHHPPLRVPPHAPLLLRARRRGARAHRDRHPPLRQPPGRRAPGRVPPPAAAVPLRRAHRAPRPLLPPAPPSGQSPAWPAGQSCVGRPGGGRHLEPAQGRSPGGGAGAGAGRGARGRWGAR